MTKIFSFLFLAFIFAIIIFLAVAIGGFQGVANFLFFAFLFTFVLAYNYYKQ